MVLAKVRLLGAHAPFTHNRGAGMSKKQKNSKTVIFALTMPKTEIPFTKLATPLKRFSKLREDFEILGLRVEIVDFRK
jgi:hypothetical protein